MWLVTFNATKTVYLQVTRKQNPSPKPRLYLDGEQIKEVMTHKHLGLTFNGTLTWSDHIGQLVSKASKCIGLLRRISRDVPRRCLEILYKSMIRPLLEYADIIYDGSADNQLKRLEDTQRQAALTCTGAYKHTNHNRLLEELGWPPLSLQRRHHRLNLMFKIQHQLSPRYLTDSCPVLTQDRTNYNLRSGLNITTPIQKTATYQNSFFPQTIKDWNNLKQETRLLKSIDTFKDTLKKSSGYKTKSLFHHNSSKAAINHTRMRLGLSGLSSHRHDYRHIDNPECPTCKATSEDPTHYFLTCPTYTGPRPTLIWEICQILYSYDIAVDFLSRPFRIFFINTLLNGSPLLRHSDNKDIFKHTHLYIKESKRFP